ncbi:MAG: substrate-binding domain-containing protein [Opitutaceae bacterium]|jgi:phosphate transport system substrate-binding protein|nr:substrate-binding domain-containing protein [Opitutaceae bacterium]
MRFPYPILSALALLAGSLPGQVKMVVSDILPASFAETVGRETHAGDQDVKVSLKGSRTGLLELKNGEAQFAVFVLKPGEQPPEGEIVSIVAAYQTAVAVAAATLPLTQVTFEQLDTIFCEDAPSSLKRWGDLGVPGLWVARPIQPVMAGPNTGLCFDLFRHTALRSANIKLGMPVLGTTDDVVAKLLSDEGGLAILPVLPKNPRFKALLVAKDAQSRAYPPTPGAIHAGDYPIRLPIYMAFKKADSRRLFGIARFLLSEEGAEAWEAAGLVPLPVEARNKQILDIEVL